MTRRRPTARPSSSACSEVEQTAVGCARGVRHSEQSLGITGFFLMQASARLHPDTEFGQGCLLRSLKTATRAGKWKPTASSTTTRSWESIPASVPRISGAGSTVSPSAITPTIRRPATAIASTCWWRPTTCSRTPARRAQYDVLYNQIVGTRQNFSHERQGRRHGWPGCRHPVQAAVGLLQQAASEHPRAGRARDGAGADLQLQDRDP